KLVENVERMLANTISKQVVATKKLQDIVDERITSDKATMIRKYATEQKYDDCMELIDGENTRLVNIAYDQLLFNKLMKGLALSSFDVKTSEVVNQIIVDWPKKVGPWVACFYSLSKY